MFQYVISSLSCLVANRGGVLTPKSPLAMTVPSINWSGPQGYASRKRVNLDDLTATPLVSYAQGKGHVSRHYI